MGPGKQRIPLGNVFPSDQFIFWRLVMKRISILVWILCACFVSVAWGQKNGWSEFHRPDMTRFNPSEKVLNVNNVADLQLKWRYPAASSRIAPFQLEVDRKSTR